MSVDVLQSKIRKLKNPSMVRLDVTFEQLPPQLQQMQKETGDGFFQYEMSLMEALKDIVPALFFDFDAYALGGAKRLEQLKENLAFAQKLGYYVLLQYAGVVSARDAKEAARILLSGESDWQWDGLVISGNIGTDGIEPFVDGVKNTEQDIFVIVRTGNKSAASVQDLMTGGRLSHLATADIVNRLGKPYCGKFGYSRICGVAPAGAPDCLKGLRSKYTDMFLLIHGYDNPGANAKLCAPGFDRLGYGAVALSDGAIAAAWTEAEGSDGSDFAEQAVAAAERMKKNLTRYITIF